MSINPREIPTGAVRYNTDSNKMEVYIAHMDGGCCKHTKSR